MSWARDWLIAAFLSAGGLGALGYLLRKWVDALFESRLQAERNRLDAALADHRSLVEARLDRLRRFAEGEAQALANAWEALNAYVDSSRAALGRLKSYPDVARLSEDVFASLLEQSELSMPARLQISQSPDRAKAYQAAIDLRELAEARAKAREFRRVFIRSVLFLGEEIRGRLHRVDELAWQALVEHGVRLEAGPSPELWKAQQAFFDEVDDLLFGLEGMMRAQLVRANPP